MKLTSLTWPTVIVAVFLHRSDKVTVEAFVTTTAATSSPSTTTRTAFLVDKLSSTSSSSSSSSSTRSVTLDSVFQLAVSTSTTETAPPSLDEFSSVPERGSDGIYHLQTADQHKTLLEANPNKLVICKVFAPWCKACKAVEPKFLAISKDPKFQGLPIVWADLTVAGNKAYIKEQGILALPTMLFYAGSEGLVENFPCGPSKIPIMKRKLDSLVQDWVNFDTMDLKVMLQPSDLMTLEEDQPCAERSVVAIETSSTDLTVDGVALSKEAIDEFRQIPFFKDLEEAEFLQTLSKAKLRTWEKGSVIMREGKKGRTFYVIESGEVEILVKTAFADPMSSPSNYLGTVLNRFSKGEYFGERALITGEPRAASVRAADKTRCFAFDKDDIPTSSVLSGKAGQATAMRLAEVNDKYGVDVSDLELIQVRKSIEDSKLGSQIRGSLNTPKPIKGVDTMDDEDTPMGTAFDTSSLASNDTIINLLQRLRIIKYAARCFNYIISTRPSWTAGAQRRRSMLVDKLSLAQRQEFQELFSIIDVSGDKAISLWELKRVMECIGEEKTDSELEEMVTTGHSGMDGAQVLTFDGFMGIMAEAEFFQLFTETFSSLDKYNTGFVKAQDLDRMLCGMRDLISDDRKSIIDVEDTEMMIDYEQFSRMLLGGSLLSAAGDLSP